MAQHLMAAVSAAILAVFTSLAGAGGSPTEPPPWRHPVEAVIVDYFRAPSGPYGPGNRGLEYDTQAGQAVVAVADGQVSFAGSVGAHQFVVVAHSPELRSTSAYLERIDVSVGDTVVGGQPIATAAPGFHLTARLNGIYVDPLRYLGSRWSVRLVAKPSGPH